MKNKNNYVFLLLIFMFSIVTFLVVFSLDFISSYGNSGKLIINEVMSKNTYTLLDNENNYSDWIELYNGYDYDINLKGYYLSDNFNHYKWEFPDVVVKKNSYLIVYASEKNYCDGNICHTNFKLNNSGEEITLTNSNREVLSRIKYEKMENDISYGYNGEKYGYYYQATPGDENLKEVYDEVIKRDSSNVSIRINEYMNNNEVSSYDEDKDNSNWIELYNYGDSDVNLSGFYLSDDLDKANKYRLGEVVLKSNSYLVIYVDGKSKVDKNIHTSFSLSTSDNVLVLSDSNLNVIDKIKIESLPNDVSSGYYEGNFVYYTKSTKGKENAYSYYESISELKNIKKDLVINEVTSLTKEAVEIKNISDKTLNLKNYKIGDKSGVIKNLPNVSLKPGDLYVYYGLNISNSEEYIYLYDSNNYQIDKMHTGKMVKGISYGLDSNGDVSILKSQTLGKNNTDSKYKGFLNNINFSINGGYVNKGAIIYLSSSDKDVDIYYTLDGSYPTNKSLKYSEGIVIDKTTVVKAIAVKSGYVNSDYEVRTFFIEDKHDIAIVSLSTNNEYMFGDNGIYTKYRQDKEKPISFEFYESDGTLGTSFNGGVKLVGQDSRNYAQKSMAIYLRKEYGQKEVVYPFFEDNINTFSSFILRNSGEDVVNMKMKDAFLVATIKGQMDIDYQDYRPVAVYINGKYWGLYFIREKINESYISNHHGVDEDNIDLIKGIKDVRSGTLDNYNELIKYLKNHDMTDPKVYEYLESKIDMKSLCEYWIFQTYYQNTDTGNIRFWTLHDGSGKWRWALFDLDWCMFPTTYKRIRFNYPFKPDGHGYKNSFPTTVTYYLWKNPEFKDLYLKTFAYHLENTFKPERVHKILDEVSGMVRSEMPRQIERWHDELASQGYGSVNSMKSWDKKLTLMKTMLTNRYDLVVKNLKSQFNLTEKEYQKYFGNL